MSIDYSSIAGYGVEVCESDLEGTKYYNEDSHLEEMLDEALDNTGLEYCSAGNHFTGDARYYILLDDPLNNDIEEFIKKLKGLDLDLNVRSQNDLLWINEVCIW